MRRRSRAKSSREPPNRKSSARRRKTRRKKRSNFEFSMLNVEFGIQHLELRISAVSHETRRGSRQSGKEVRRDAAQYRVCGRRHLRGSARVRVLPVEIRRGG